jgi:anaerobic selenocysteine-containing dehydrogenase
VREYPPDVVARWTGIAADDIRRLARDYATTRTAVIRLNYGIQRCENGGMATRAVAMLPTITGSWKEVGGDLQLSTSGAFKINRAGLERQDLEAKAENGRVPRSINMVELGRELNERVDPPIRALYVYNSNPAAVCPNHAAVVRGLQRPELFTVVHEQFLTDTCDYADIVLPATTFFEHRDLQTSYGHYYLQLSEQAIAPLGECRSNVETFRALALRMGFDDPCFRQSSDEMIDLALETQDPWLGGITQERLQAEGHVRLAFPASPGPSDGIAEGEQGDHRGFFLPFAAGGFPTPSGKAELYSAALAAEGLDPVLKFTPPTESRQGSGAGVYPLELLARKADNFLNSTFCNLPGHQLLEERDRLDMNWADAEARGIRDGDAVRVYNDRGEVRLRARVDAGGSGAVPPGVVAATLNWAKLAPGGQVNVLTSDRLSDMGGAATFYSALVEVAKA